MTRAATLLTLFFVAALPLAARAQQPAPITIKACSIQQYVYTPAHPFWYPWGPIGPFGTPVTDGIRIQYVNTSTKVATRVAFLVNYRGDVEHIVDAGTFSPGVTIDHTFAQYTGQVYQGSNPNQCAPIAVRFSDGTIWRSPTLRRQPAQ